MSGPVPTARRPARHLGVGAALALAAIALAVLSCAPTGSSYTIRLVNQDSLALDSVVVEGGGVRVEFGSVLPGGEAHRTFVLERDALLHLTGLCGARPIRILLGGYARRGPGGRVDVVVTPGGDLSFGSPVPDD